MRNNLLKKGILLIMAFSMILSLLGCSGKSGGSGAGGKTIEFMEFRVSGMTPGFIYRIEDGKITWENGTEKTGGKHKADKGTIATLMELFEKLDVYSWDGFEATDDGTADGRNFALLVTFSDKTSIKAGGENAFPENFEEFEAAIISLMQ